MASSFPLRATLGALQDQMLADFSRATAEIEHRGAKGREREALVVAKYLDHYLPPSLPAVHGAEILDSTGNRSAECDVVIEDASTPPLYLGDTFRLIPVEWAHGVIEVKSKLDTTQLQDAQTKIARAKSLRKLTYVPQTGDIQWGIDAYGTHFEYFPMYGLVFAYSSTKLPALADALWGLQQSVPVEAWIDAVVVLDQGVLFYTDPGGGFASRPQPGCSLAAISSDVALVPATLAIQTAFGGVWMPPAKLGPYTGPEPWGDVVHVVGDRS